MQYGPQFNIILVSSLRLHNQDHRCSPGHLLNVTLQKSMREFTTFSLIPNEKFFLLSRYLLITKLFAYALIEWFNYPE